MFDNIEELLKKIALGEDSSLELKEVRFKGGKVSSPHSDGMADELAAMANTLSGVVILGVDDKTKEITGIPEENIDTVEEWLRNICNDKIIPQLHCNIRKIIITGSDGIDRCIIKIDVPRSLEVHKSPNGYFTRIGSSKRELSPELLARLFQQRSQTRLIRFDESIINNASYDELSQNLWGKYRTPLSPDDNIEFLTKSRFIAEGDDGKYHPTVTGMLVGSDKPENYLSGAFIQAVFYRGKERNAAYQIDAKDITGPIDEQVREACRFVQKNMKTGAQKVPGRIEKPQFSINAVFEAVVNAVAHRDYSITGSKIRLHLFSDRLEIYSPGALPNTLTIESIQERQFTRNETLTSFLARCKVMLDFLTTQRQYLMDKRGEGVPIIILESEKLSGKRPVYELIDNTELKLTIWAAEVYY